MRKNNAIQVEFKFNKKTIKKFKIIEEEWEFSNFNFSKVPVVGDIIQFKNSKPDDKIEEEFLKRFNTIEFIVVLRKCIVIKCPDSSFYDDWWEIFIKPMNEALNGSS